jgi:hypothetical protein
MTPSDRRKADLVLVLHFAVVVYAVAGGLLSFFLPWNAAIQIPVVLWSGIVNLAGWTCPLTPLEKRYQKASGGGQGDAGDLLTNFSRSPMGSGFEDCKIEESSNLQVLPTQCDPG